MSNTTKRIPDGYTSISPYLVVEGAAEAIDFYQRAFGAEERCRMPCPQGKIMHAELIIGDTTLMLSDPNPELGDRSPRDVGGTPVTLFLYVEDVDQVFQRALSEGAREDQPLTDMFWGDRYGRLTDPFGHQWSLASHIEDVAPEEMGRRAEAFFAAAAK